MHNPKHMNTITIPFAELRRTGRQWRLQHRYGGHIMKCFTDYLVRTNPANQATVIADLTARVVLMKRESPMQVLLRAGDHNEEFCWIASQLPNSGLMRSIKVAIATEMDVLAAMPDRALDLALDLPRAQMRTAFAEVCRLMANPPNCQQEVLVRLEAFLTYQLRVLEETEGLGTVIDIEHEDDDDDEGAIIPATPAMKGDQETEEEENIPELEVIRLSEIAPTELGDLELWNMLYSVASGALSKVTTSKKPITKRGIAVLNLAMSCPNQKLECLELDRTGLDIAGARALASYLPSMLARLNLDGNQIGDDGAADIVANLPSTIQLLWLDGNGISDAGAIAIAPRLPASLRSLTLNGNQIGDPGVRALASWLPRSLDTLFLNANRIGDLGAKVLAARMPPRLTRLSLSGNQIGGSGISAIVSSLPKSVAQLWLKDNPYGPIGTLAILGSWFATSAKIYW